MMKPSTILIVDDSDAIRTPIREALESLGYQNVLEAVDGKEALDVLMEHKVHLILSDLDMPKVNGLDLLKALRNHSAFKEMPFLVLTFDVEQDLFHKAMECGASGFIRLPVTSEKLSEKVTSFLLNSG